MNLTEKVYTSAYSFTSRAAFGMETKEQQMFVSSVQESMQLATGFDLADVYPSIKLLRVMSRTKWRLTKLHHKADKILENIIYQHKVEKSADCTRQDDLVDVLLRFQESGHELPLTIDNIKAVILVISV